MRSSKMVYFFGFTVLLFAMVICVRIFAAGKPPFLGVRNGRLPTCPDSPNCVCSQATDALHQIEPVSFQGTTGEAIERIEKVVASLPRMTVVSKSTSDGYVHAEARSWLFRFVDDVEFLYDAQQHVIHVRSASRVGYSDLGVNRSRIESLRHAFQSLDVPKP